jgi:hypothetical protein
VWDTEVAVRWTFGPIRTILIRLTIITTISSSSNNITTNIITNNNNMPLITDR